MRKGRGLRAAQPLARELFENRTIRENEGQMPAARSTLSLEVDTDFAGFDFLLPAIEVGPPRVDPPS